MGSFVDRIYCGVDIGAAATKLVLIDAGKEVLAREALPSGVDYAATAQRCLDLALGTAGLTGPLTVTVATGYGRNNVDFAQETRTEIHCHGLGCFHGAPGAMTLIDIGGQDNKVIHLDDKGRRRDFHMNRKCAAGTGAFVEEIALRLGLQVGELNGLARSTLEPVKLGSFCTVFAKTEILSHLRRGEPVAGIVRGAFVSVVDRILEMDPLEGDVVATGGVVAFNSVIVDILGERLGRPVSVPEEPRFTGALGAALTAAALDGEPDSQQRKA